MTYAYIAWAIIASACVGYYCNSVSLTLATYAAIMAVLNGVRFHLDDTQRGATSK